MENKNLKILLYIVLGLMVVQFLYSMFGVNKNLNDALSKLQDSQKKLDSAITIIDKSKLKIDSARTKLNDFSTYVEDIQGRVQILDLENRKNDVKYKAKADSIRKKLNILYKEFNIETDSLIPLVEELPRK